MAPRAAYASVLPPRAAQKCLSMVATDAEREDRLGDLEEAFHRAVLRSGLSAARHRYLKDSFTCILAILRRRLVRAGLYGGQDMLRIFFGAAITIVLVFLGYIAESGDLWVFVQPFELLMVLVAIAGFALTSNRLGAWGHILRDLRRARRLTPTARANARTVIIAKLSDAKEDGRKAEFGSDFSHLQHIAALATHTPNPDADSLIQASIALFRERCQQRLNVIKASISDTYIASAMAFLMGLVNTFEYLTQRPEVIGGLLSGALAAFFFGMVIARGILAPIANRLSDLYSEDYCEMEAMRASLPAGGPVAEAAFEALLSPKRALGFL